MCAPLRGLVVLLLLVMSGITYARATVWTSEYTLWTDAAAKAPQKPRPFINLGLAQEGTGDMDAALRTHQTALALSFQPRLTRYQQNFSRIASETNIARILAQTGREEAALRILDDVIARHPLFHFARYNRAVLLARTGRCAEGQPDAQLAVALDPSFQEIRCVSPSSR